MTDIKKSLRKYETIDGQNKRVKGEITTDNYRNMERQTANLHTLCYEKINFKRLVARITD